MSNSLARSLTLLLGRVEFGLTGYNLEFAESEVDLKAVGDVNSFRGIVNGLDLVPLLFTRDEMGCFGEIATELAILEFKAWEFWWMDR